MMMDWMMADGWEKLKEETQQRMEWQPWQRHTSGSLRGREPKEEEAVSHMNKNRRVNQVAS